MPKNSTSTLKSTRQTRQSTLLTFGENHRRNMGFCSTPCEVCEADMADRIRRNR